MGMLVEQNKKTKMIELEDAAKRMLSSGLLPDEINTLQKAVAIAMKGSELGIPPVQALSEIYVVKGKAELKAELKLQLACERVAGFAYDILEMSDDKCVVEYRRLNRKPFRYTYTIEQAQRAGLTSNPVWKKYTDYMLFNRNVSMALKVFAPDYKLAGFSVDISESIDQSGVIDCEKDPVEDRFVEAIVNKETGEIYDTEIVVDSTEPVVDTKKSNTLFDVEEKEVGQEGKTSFKCSLCKKVITPEVMKFSIGKFGKELCYKCQQEEKR